ncbi:MAG: hypothetical protein RXS42_09390, partial [Nitrososphaeria archaeon]
MTLPGCVAVKDPLWAVARPLVETHVYCTPAAPDDGCHESVRDPLNVAPGISGNPQLQTLQPHPDLRLKYHVFWIHHLFIVFGSRAVDQEHRDAPQAALLSHGLHKHVQLGIVP